MLDAGVENFVNVDSTFREAEPVPAGKLPLPSFPEGDNEIQSDVDSTFREAEPVVANEYPLPSFPKGDNEIRCCRRNRVTRFNRKERV